MNVDTLPLGDQGSIFLVQFLTYFLGVIFRISNNQVTIAFEEISDEISDSNHLYTLHKYLEFTFVLFLFFRLGNEVTYKRLKDISEKILNLNEGPSIHLFKYLFHDNPESKIEPSFVLPLRKISSSHLVIYLCSYLHPIQQWTQSFSIRCDFLRSICKSRGFDSWTPRNWQDHDFGMFLETSIVTRQVEFILQEVKRGKKVLACAPSNIAVGSGNFTEFS